MKYNIIIVGCGGTGGNFIKELGRFLYRASIKNSCSILLIDGDLVEEHNVSRQPFLPEDVGRKKAAVMAEILQEAFQVTCSYYQKYQMKFDLKLAETLKIGDFSISPILKLTQFYTYFIPTDYENRFCNFINKENFLQFLGVIPMRFSIK